MPDRSTVRSRIRDRSLRETIQCCVWLRQQPPRARMLFELTCRVCSPLIYKKSDDILHSLFGATVDISQPTPNCVFCDIIRQCRDHFVDSSDPWTNCAVTYGRTGFDVQLCLRREKEFCLHHHLQLYSDGMSVRSALFIY